MAINSKYISDFEAKKAICEIGGRMYEKNFVASVSGSISAKTGPNALWITPIGVSKRDVKPDMLVKTDMSGNVTIGRLKPSPELELHLSLYAENPDASAVIYAFPPMAAARYFSDTGTDGAPKVSGTLVWGKSALEAYFKLEDIEHNAFIHTYSEIIKIARLLDNDKKAGFTGTEGKRVESPDENKQDLIRAVVEKVTGDILNGRR